MTALELLDRLASLGIAAILEDGRLFLQPGDRVPPELMDEARAHKAELVAALSNRRVPAETGLQTLLERLRTGRRGSPPTLIGTWLLSRLAIRCSWRAGKRG